MYKLLKIVVFGSDNLKGCYYSIFYCDPDDYDVFKRVDYFPYSCIVMDIKDCMPGDLIKVKKYYNLSNFEDIVYEIEKIKN